MSQYQRTKNYTILYDPAEEGAFPIGNALSQTDFYETMAMGHFTPFTVIQVGDRILLVMDNPHIVTGTERKQITKTITEEECQVIINSQ